MPLSFCYAFLLADFEGGLALFAKDSSLLAASPSSEVWRSPPTGELLAKTAGQLAAQFSIVFADPIGNESLVMVAASANGSVAVGAFSPANLARRSLADTFSSEGQGFVLMMDDQGRLLYQAGAVPSGEAEISQHPGVAEALRGQTGTTYLSIGDSEHVVAFSPIPPVGWALVI